MRSFSDTEKRILRFMAYPPIPQDVCLISIFENFSDCYLIEWPEDCSSLELVHAQDKDWKDVRNKIFDIIVLLQYLESNQYIGVFQLNLLKDNQIFNRKKFEVEKDDKGNILMWIIDTCKLNIKIPNDKGIEGEYTRKLLVETSILKENTTAAEQIKRYANSSFFAKNAVSMWFSDKNTNFKLGRSVQSRCRLVRFIKKSTITLCFGIPLI